MSEKTKFAWTDPDWKLPLRWNGILSDRLRIQAFDVPVNHRLNGGEGSDEGAVKIHESPGRGIVERYVDKRALDRQLDSLDNNAKTPSGFPIDSRGHFKAAVCTVTLFFHRRPPSASGTLAWWLVLQSLAARFAESNPLLNFGPLLLKRGPPGGDQTGVGSVHGIAHHPGQIGDLESCTNANGVGDLLAEKLLHLLHIRVADSKAGAKHLGAQRSQQQFGVDGGPCQIVRFVNGLLSVPDQPVFPAIAEDSEGHDLWALRRALSEGKCVICGNPKAREALLGKDSHLEVTIVEKFGRHVGAAFFCPHRSMASIGTP